MKKPSRITLSIADARWLQGFLASQHDKAGDPIRVEALDRQLGPMPRSATASPGHKDGR